MEVVTEIWQRAVSVQPAPTSGMVALVAAAALLLVTLPATWPLTRQIITISHEGGHATAALIAGRRLSAIRLHSDTSGLTVSRGRRAGPGMVLMLLAGYLAPAVAGLGAALLLGAGHALGLLWLIVAWLSLMMLQIRNAYGFVVLLGCGAGVALVSWYLPAELQSLVAYLIVWVLLIAAPKPLLELVVQRRRGGARHSDADQLARLTRVPAPVWIGMFLVANVVGLALGVALLLPRVAELAASLGAGLIG